MAAEKVEKELKNYMMKEKDFLSIPVAAFITFNT